MTRRRWIADEVEGDTAALVGDHAAHLARVLRAAVGQEFDIATGQTVRRGTVTSISDARVEFALGEEQSAPSAPDVTLALSIFKFDRMEWAIEKCSEIGVSRIIPVISRRTDVHLAVAAIKRRDRWQRIVLQAAEQSRHASPPEVALPVKVKELIDENRSSPRIVLSENEANASLRDMLADHAGSLILAIGPEGGWTEEELQKFRSSGWTAASLGGGILRAETAAIVATALAIDTLR